MSHEIRHILPTDRPGSIDSFCSYGGVQGQPHTNAGIQYTFLRQMFVYLCLQPPISLRKNDPRIRHARSSAYLFQAVFSHKSRSCNSTNSGHYNHTIHKTKTKTTTMKLSKVFLLSTLACTCKAAEEAAHSCACEAEELGFQINCAATDVMLSSMAFLKSSGCATDCSSPECEKNYLIVQSHHDYCPEAGVPEEVCYRV